MAQHNSSSRPNRANREASPETKSKLPSMMADQTPPSPEGMMLPQLAQFIQQGKYQKALDEIKKIRRTQPDFQPQISEAELWLKAGQQEQVLRKAEECIRQAAALGLPEAYYFLSRNLLAQDKPKAVLPLLKQAFEQNQLTSQWNILYAKALLLEEQFSTVAELLKSHKGQFPIGHRHWLQGVLFFHAQQYQEAIDCFLKVKAPITPEDQPDVWLIAAYQANQQWDEAQQRLARYKPSSSELILRLRAYQACQTLDSRLVSPLSMPNLEFGRSKEGLEILDTIKLVVCLNGIAQRDWVTATTALLSMNAANRRFPDIAQLREPLLILGSQQAWAKGDPGQAVEFLKGLVNNPQVDGQLLVNFFRATYITAQHSETQKVLVRLQRWVEQQSKQQPQDWPEHKLKATLSHIHCHLTDAWMALQKASAAWTALEQAARLWPESPEVLGRQGLKILFETGDEPRAMELLTRALDGGCTMSIVYRELIRNLKSLNDQAAVKAARRKYGARFNDIVFEYEVDIPEWVSALSTRYFAFFATLVDESSETTPPTEACRSFLQCVDRQAMFTSKPVLKQAEASRRWDRQLNKLAEADQISVLQAICIMLRILPKQEKGIAGLIKQYQQRLEELAERFPEAQAAAIVVMAVKRTSANLIAKRLQPYLRQSNQPGVALAQIQLMARRFTDVSPLACFIDEALQNEPQNSQLLLAKATLYPSSHPYYRQFYDQGFDLARRLQDGKALAAFRAEDAFLEDLLLSQSFIQTSCNPSSFEQFIISIARQMLGRDPTPQEVADLVNQMDTTMPDIEDSDEPSRSTSSMSDPFTHDQDFFFSLPPNKSKGFSAPPTRPRKK